jgi:putative salt-induced outer membrane protein YdiY
MQKHRSYVVTAVSVSLLLIMSCAAKAEEVASAPVPAPTPPAAPANPDVVKDWNGNVSLGLSLANGNSSAFGVNAGAILDKQWKKDEWHFAANGQYAVTDYGTSNQTTSANNMHGTTYYRHLFSDQFYGYLGLEAMHDDVAFISYRFITSPGLGYYLIKKPETRLRLEGGPSWIYERDHADGHTTKNYMAARIAERGEQDLGKNAKVWEQVEYLPKIDDWGSYLLNAEVGAEASMTKTLSMRIVARDQYNSDPAVGTKSNDITVIAALVYKFGPQ